MQVKIQQIINLCKKTGELYVVHTGDVQWVGNGQAMYPLYDLPKLTAEELCNIYSITEEQQSKMILNDKKAEDFPGVDFDEAGASDIPVEINKMAIIYAGQTMLTLKSGDEINFARRIYFTPFKEEIELWKKECAVGTYYVVTTGMLTVGIIFPEMDMRINIAAEIKELANKL